MIHLEPREILDAAIIGKDEETDRLIYSRDILIDIFSQQHKEQNPDSTDQECISIAVDHIGYNIEGMAQNYSKWPIIQDEEE
jgi:hypothetical protein